MEGFILVDRGLPICQSAYHLLCVYLFVPCLFHATRIALFELIETFVADLTRPCGELFQNLLVVADTG
jgi:hypothetical protein